MWYKLAQSVGDEFPVVVLYHGTLETNYPSIQKEGIVPKASNADARISETLKFISDSLQLTPEQRKELYDSTWSQHAKNRLSQTSNKVYLSGEEHYASSNAAASTEWFDVLYQAAKRAKYEQYFEARYQYSSQIQKLYKQLKQLDGLRYRQQAALGEDNKMIETLRDIYQQQKMVETKIKQLEEQEQAKLSAPQKVIEQEYQAVFEKQFGKNVVIIRVEMPYDVFKSKITSEHSAERIKMFEETYKKYKAGDAQYNWFNEVKKGTYDNVWAFFGEVHLTSVEPQYFKEAHTRPMQRFVPGVNI